MAPKGHIGDQYGFGRRDLIRRFGAAGSAAAVAGIAGCLGDDDDGDDDDGDDGTGDEPVIDAYHTGFDRIPDQIQWNTYNPTETPGPIRSQCWEVLFGYRQADQSFVSCDLVDDFEVDGTTMTITMADDVTWHSGEPITAEDVVTQVKMDQLMGQPIGNIVEDAEATSELTAELTLETENRIIALSAFVGQYFHAPAEIYGDYVDDYDDADSEDEIEAVREEVASFEADAFGCGPYAVTEVDTNTLFGEPHEGHPVYDIIEGVPLETQRHEGNQGLLELGLAGEVHDIGGIVMSEDNLNQLKDGFHLYSSSDLEGLAVYFNHDNEHLGRENVRRAIAHVLDREQIAINAAGLDYKNPVEIPTGISGTLTGSPRNWIGDDLDDFDTYSGGEDEATTLLEDEGYSLESDTWVDPDGETVEFEFVSPGGWTDWENAFVTVESQLSQFGFETELRTRDAPTWDDETIGGGEYDMTPYWWGGAAPHPYQGFSALFDSREQEGASIFQSVEVPMPVGDAGGSTQEIDLVDRVEQIPTASEDEEQQIVKEMGWVVNQTLPVLPIMEKLGTAWWAEDGWDTPDPDDDEMTIGPPAMTSWAFRQGYIQPERE